MAALTLRRAALSLLLIAALPGCGDEAPAPAPAEMLWDTPELPQPWSMEVAGEAVDAEVLAGFLAGEWADYCVEAEVTPEGALAALDGFTADPEARFGALVGDVLLLREGERRFPELDLAEVQDYRARMEADAGVAMEALRKRLGEGALMRHVERRLRLEKTLDALAGELALPTVEQLLEAYHEAVAGVQVEEGAAGPTFEEMEPRLRAEWRRQRWFDAGREWIAAAREGVVARVTRPDGITIEVPAP
jgi:hypothetical protein